MDYDLVVIGGGAAGISASRAGVAAGARTALINDGPPGGDCTFVGCVPSKTLIESAAQDTDFATAMARVRSTVGPIAATEDAVALGKEGIEVLSGRAVFCSPRRVRGWVVRTPWRRPLRRWACCAGCAVRALTPSST